MSAAWDTQREDIATLWGEVAERRRENRDFPGASQAFTNAETIRDAANLNRGKNFGVRRW